MHHLVPNGGRLVAANLAGRGADAGRGRGGRGRGGRGRGGAAQPPTALSVAAAASNAARTIAEQNPVVQDATYTNEQNQFIYWVEARREEGYIPPGDKYLTRENVDAYFTMVVVHMTKKPDSARRIVSSLQKLADRVEYAGEVTRFVVDASHNVELSLKIHKESFLRRARHEGSLADPQANMRTKVLTQGQKVMFVKHVLLTNKPNWQDLCLSFTGCEQMMLRNDSMRSVMLSDSHINDTHAPKQDEEFDSDMLAFAYHPYSHKENNKAKHVIGCWRHKTLEQCFTGFYAMVIAQRIRSDPEINFLRETLDQRAEWWDFRLITGWATTTAAGTAYRHVFEEIDVSWEKCTHMRKAGTEYASSRGRLAPSVIATGTKHKGPNQTKLESTYITELHQDLLKCMAGFPDSEYFVPRTRIAVDTWWDIDLTRTIFPQYDRWVSEVEDEDIGDDSSAAQNFVYDLLPWLARVVVQDGCYWIVKFPNHDISRMLHHILPRDYPEKAQQARIWVTAQLRSHEQQLEAQRNFQASVIRSHALLRQEVGQLQTTVETRMPNPNAIREAMQQGIQLGIQQGMQEMRRVHLQYLQNVNNPPNPPLAMPPAQQFQQHGGGRGNNAAGRGGRGAGAPPPAGRAGGRGAGGGRGLDGLRGGRGGGEGGRGRGRGGGRVEPAHLALRRVALEPHVPIQMPNTIVQLINHYIEFNLATFQTNPNKREWPQSLRNRYSKWSYIYKVTVEKARHLRGQHPNFESRLRHAARNLDHNRDEMGKSVNQYFTWLKSNDESTKSRQRG